MKHINKNCNHCNVELVLNENYDEHRLKRKDYICKDCYITYLDSNMYVNGAYISRSHPLHKPGRYKTFEDAAFSSLAKYPLTKEGQVYVITNKAWKGWVKIGMAIDAKDRCNQYQTSSPYRDYELKHSKYFNNRRKAEVKAHKLCEKKAEDRNGEWFKMKIKDATKLINSITEEEHEKETA